MIANCSDELVDAPTIKRPDQMLTHPERVAEIRRLLYVLLDAMERQMP